MILFKDQWNNYPGASVHINTKNKSWVELAQKYKAMGVKNHAFHLAIIDQDLIDVDPHDPNITSEQAVAIARECFLNPWYFFRECVRVPAQVGSDANMLEANRGNIALFWCAFNHATTILIQVRQTGKSVSSDVLMAYLLNIACQNTNINLLTKDDDLRRGNVIRLKDIISELPPYLRSGTKGDANNGEEITISALGNRYNTHVPQASAKRALNMGRGLSTAIVQIDEPPFQPNFHIAFPAMMPSTNAVFEEARRKGEHHFIVLTTTAGKKDTKEGAFVYKMVQDAMAFTEKLFDCTDEEELRKVVRVNSKTDEFLINITLNHRQLGKTDDWLRERIKLSRGDIEATNRDYFNVWTSGTQKSPFPVDVAERIAKSRQESTYTYIAEKYGYSLRFYIPEHEVHQRLTNGHFILGMDPSDAGGGDDLSFYLTDAETLDTIAAGTFNETNLFNLSSWVCDFLVEYKNITAIIERRSSGAAIIDHLLWFLPQRGEDPFKRLYNRVVNDYLDNRERYKEILVPLGRRPDDIYNRYKTSFGWATSGSGMMSRSGLYSTTLQNGVRLSGSRLKDNELVKQVLGLEIRNGRVDHGPGEHDDLCFVGSTLIRTDRGNIPIKELRVGDRVLTRKGFKPVLKIYRKEKDVITRFGITGTPDHPFITPKGEVQFKNLTLNSEVYVWDEKLSSIKVKNIIDILNQKDHNTESIIINTTKITNRQLPYIDKFTKIIMDLSQVVGKSTIRTMTTQTTTSIISNVSQLQNIEKDTPCQKQQEKVSKLEESKREMVYNLYVADCHEYFVNDILVHNCIGWLLTVWLLTQGMNLSHYGLDHRVVLTRVKEQEADDPVKYQQQVKQAQIKTEIEELCNELSDEKDEFIALKIEHKIKTLERLVVVENDELNSVDEMIRKAKEKKIENMRIRRQVTESYEDLYNKGVYYQNQFNNRYM